MKKTLLYTALLASGVVYASNYIVVIDTESNKYGNQKTIDSIEYSEWINKNEVYDCSTALPLVSNVYQGTSFDQIKTCSQDQERTKYTYQVDTDTGSKRIKNQEIEKQIIDVDLSESLTGTYVAKSCLDILNHYGPNTDGVYSIKPSSTTLNAYCDMENGGYTMVSRSIGSEQLTTYVENDCSSIGMKLFVPRTKLHFNKATAYFGTSYFTLMGIYPNAVGATCVNVGFNSNTCTTWDPTDKGKWFVGDFGNTEPNGDNSLNASMIYIYTNGVVTHYNDVSNDDINFNGGYKTSKWVCSSIGEQSI